MIEVFFAFLFFAVAVVLHAKARRSGAGTIFIVSAIAKFFLCISGLFVALPFSGEDAIRFEETAYYWSRMGFSDIVGTFNPSRSYNFSTIVAIFYHVLDRNLAIPIFINGILGLFISYLGLKLFSEAWPGLQTPKLFAVLIAFHPMLTINSAVILRENFVIVFFLLSTIYLVRFSRSSRVTDLGMFALFALLSAMFHGGMLFFALGLPFLVFARSKRAFLNRLFGVLVFTSILALFIAQVEIAKLHTLQSEGFSESTLAELGSARPEANSSYLEGMKPGSAVDLVWQLPVRTFFLLTKPFPWDVRSFGALIALFDALIWLTVIFYLVKNFSEIRANRGTYALLVCGTLALMAFSLGTGNFGTGLRHRTKFIVIALVIVAPWLPKFRLGRHAPLPSRLPCPVADQLSRSADR